MRARAVVAYSMAVALAWAPAALACSGPGAAEEIRRNALWGTVVLSIALGLAVVSGWARWRHQRDAKALVGALLWALVPICAYFVLPSPRSGDCGRMYLLGGWILVGIFGLGLVAQALAGRSRGGSVARLVLWAAALGALFLLVGCGAPRPAPPSAEALVAASIGYHDADGVWGTRPLVLEMEESRPDGTRRSTTVTFDPAAKLFDLDRRDGDQHLEGRISPDKCGWNLAAGDFTGEQISRLSCESLERTRSYYLYLWGLPMKLRDPGTRLGAVTWAEADGEDRLRLRVTYDPEVGSDVWDFDFDPATGALVGYRFFKDEAAGDGEWIELAEEVVAEGLRLPKVRRWFVHSDGEFLGEDRLVTVRAPSRSAEAPE